MTGEATFFLRVLFAGRVQGVGFRWSTQSVAKGFAITGYVKNLHDGTVELMAEGEVSEARGFLDALRSRMSGYVENCEVTEGTATRRYQEFSIAY
jgi:acylphosphatase